MRILIAALATTLLLPAQDDERKARFSVDLAFGGGRFEHTTDGSNLDDHTDAAMFRLRLEATSRRGFGGGLRIEGIGSDDDLFVDAGFAANEARWSNIFLHFTYRAEVDRFAMPVRIGLLLDGYVLDEDSTDTQQTFGSIGPYLELAPEFDLVHERKLSWSVYGVVGVGAAVTGIDIDGDPNDYTSSTGFLGLEAGTRLRVGPVTLGVGIVGRWASMNESDEENLSVVLGHDTEFVGILISGGVVF